MNLIQIATGSIKRRKARMTFLVLSIIIGVGTAVALLTVSQAMKQEIGNRLDELGANIIVVPKSDQLHLSYGGISIPGVSYDVQDLEQSAVDLIAKSKRAENIAIVAPKLVGAVKIGNTPALLAGVDFAQELRMKKWWEIEGAAPATPAEVLVGYDLAARLGVASGQQLTVKGRQFTVTGVLRQMGSAEDSLLFAQLPVAQQILEKPGRLSFIEVSAYCSACPIDEIAAAIAAVLPGAEVTPLRQAAASRVAAVQGFSQFALIVSLVVLLIGSLVVAMTMMSSVVERTREIGVFRALGFRKAHVGRIILTEALMLSLPAGVIAYLTGLAAAKALGPGLAATQVPIILNPALAAMAVALAVVSAVGASIYPAYKAAHIDPAQALRFI